MSARYIHADTQTIHENHAWVGKANLFFFLFFVFFAKPVETVYFNCPIKSSEIERSIPFDLPIFFVSSILFDSVLGNRTQSFD